MTQQEWISVERTIRDLSSDEKIELIERIAHSLREESDSPDRHDPQAPVAYKPIWEVFKEISDGIPDEEWAEPPTDGASQLDHYLHGAPKRPTP